MKLLGNPRSPYAKKIVIALKEKGMAFEYLEVAASDPAVAAANPLAKIPTLICDNGEALFDSPVIAEYVDGLDGAPKLIPTKFADRIAVKQWEALSDGVTDAAVALFHEEREPVEKRKGPAYTAKQTKKIDAGLATLEAALAKGEYLHDDEFSLGDVACYCALAFLDRSQASFDWRKAYPNLADFAARLALRPSIAQS